MYSTWSYMCNGLYQIVLLKKYNTVMPRITPCVTSQNVMRYAAMRGCHLKSPIFFGEIIYRLFFFSIFRIFNLHNNISLLGTLKLQNYVRNLISLFL